MGSGSERLGARLPQPHEARPPAFLRQAPRLYSGGVSQISREEEESLTQTCLPCDQALQEQRAKGTHVS